MVSGQVSFQFMLYYYSSTSRAEEKTKTNQQLSNVAFVHSFLAGHDGAPLVVCVHAVHVPMTELFLSDYRKKQKKFS